MESRLSDQQLIRSSVRENTPHQPLDVYFLHGMPGYKGSATDQHVGNTNSTRRANKMEKGWERRVYEGTLTKSSKCFLYVPWLKLVNNKTTVYLYHHDGRYAAQPNHPRINSRCQYNQLSMYRIILITFTCTLNSRTRTPLR